MHKIHAHIKVLRKNFRETSPGDGYVVKFYDHDFFRNDFLGEVVLDSSGETMMEIKPNNFGTESLNHEFPNLYFEVCRDGQVIYKSDVYSKKHWQVRKDISGTSHLIYELGNILM